METFLVFIAVTFIVTASVSLLSKIVNSYLNKKSYDLLFEIVFLIIGIMLLINN